MKFCTYCGQQLSDEAAFCSRCGRSTTGMPAPAATNNNALLTKLSERVKTNGIIWIVLAAIQIVIGLCGTWVTLIVGALNIVSAIKDLNYSKEVLENPKGIVANFEPLTSPIITLVYNVVIGGVIGVAGSIYYFVALRSFVMENKQAFLDLERGQ